MSSRKARSLKSPSRTVICCFYITLRIMLISGISYVLRNFPPRWNVSTWTKLLYLTQTFPPALTFLQPSLPWCSLSLGDYLDVIYSYKLGHCPHQLSLVLQSFTNVLSLFGRSSLQSKVSFHDHLLLAATVIYGCKCKYLEENLRKTSHLLNKTIAMVPPIGPIIFSVINFCPGLLTVSDMNSLLWGRPYIQSESYCLYPY